jgi:hypothetical protein
LKSRFLKVFFVVINIVFLIGAIITILTPLKDPYGVSIETPVSSIENVIKLLGILIIQIVINVLIFNKTKKKAK